MQKPVPEHVPSQNFLGFRIQCSIIPLNLLHLSSMSVQSNGSYEDDLTKRSRYDVIVVGAGFAGIRMVFELRKLGLSFKLLEEGSNIGGTWCVFDPWILPT